jgi:hypothetical protein
MIALLEVYIHKNKTGLPKVNEDCAADKLIFVFGSDVPRKAP